MTGIEIAKPSQILVHCVQTLFLDALISLFNHFFLNLTCHWNGLMIAIKLLDSAGKGIRMASARSVQGVVKSTTFSRAAIVGLLARMTSAS